MSRRIDCAEADRLRRSGLTWPQIAERLPAEKIKFTPRGISCAVAKWKKENRI